MVGKRKQGPPRCAVCGLHESLCVCESMPRIRLSHPMVIVRNEHERNKPTNTGRLVLRMIENATLVPYAVRGETFDGTALREPNTDYHLVFPRHDERDRPPPVLGRHHVHAERPSAVVLLDGTWGQCSRMGRRIPELARMPAYRLPDGPPSRWTVREAPDPARVSTADAAIRVVRVLEGDEAADRMQAWFDRVTAGLLFMKGKLPRPEVPPSW